MMKLTYTVVIEIDACDVADVFVFSKDNCIGETSVLLEPYAAPAMIGKLLVDAALRDQNPVIEREWITRAEYEDLVEDGISEDKNCGGDIGASVPSREYVEGYLRKQYLIIGEDKETN